MVLQNCLNWGSNLCTEWWYFFKGRLYAFRLKIYNLNTVATRIRKLIAFYHFSQILNFHFQASVLTFQLIIFINAFFQESFMMLKLFFNLPVLWCFYFLESCASFFRLVDWVVWWYVAEECFFRGERFFVGDLGVSQNKFIELGVFKGSVFCEFFMGRQLTVWSMVILCIKLVIESDFIGGVHTFVVGIGRMDFAIFLWSFIENFFSGSGGSWTSVSDLGGILGFWRGIRR